MAFERAHACAPRRRGCRGTVSLAADAGRERNQTGNDVGLFSFLKKKNQPVAPWPETRLRSGEPSRLENEAERARQREIARATAAKIDEIELEMASDFFNDEPDWANVPRAPAAASPLSPDAPAAEEVPDPAAAPVAAPVVEESAILYANGQAGAAEQMLLASLPGPGRSERLPWWMLFDLYQASGRAQAFESIAIDYASHFETSPPTWSPQAQPGAPAHGFAGVTPTEAFAGVLDGQVEARLRRLREAARASAVLRLEFGAVRAATPEGCERLLAALRALRGGGAELVVAGADTLLAVLRPMLAIGARDSSQAPWLLLLELLQLMNREKDFEETAMDYCVTFEVSPPSFEAPRRAATVASASPVAGDRFMLPALVEGDPAPLLAAIDAYAGQYDTVVLDCSRLARIDYGAASALQGRLRALAVDGRRIELRDLNHLVAALFKLLGYGDSAHLFAHRY
jgi:ABC-type transporter Mla MlaB component